MTWIDFISILIIGYAFFRGYRDGLIMQVASLLGLVFGAIFAGAIARFLEPHLASIFKTPSPVAGTIAYLVAFVLILFGFFSLGKILKGFVKAIQIGCLDKLGGVFFCGLKWLLIFSLFLNVVEKLDSHEWIIKAETKQKSVMHPFVKGLMPVIVPFFSAHINNKDKEVKLTKPIQHQEKRHATI